MGKLVYSMITSLDGFIEDEQGNFDWAAPDDELHAFANTLQRGIGTCLYGRRLYETMLFWETPASDLAGEPEVIREFAEVWKGADKIVYSSTLDAPTTARTRIERAFDPEAVRRLKDESAADLSIGGANLAAAALRAGLVDQLEAIAVPVVVGGGKRWLPPGLKLGLELLDERRFAGGTVFLRYRVLPSI